jgi:hypothetical protein
MVSTLYLECGPESACFPNFAYKFNVLWVNVLCRYVEEAESHAGRVKKATALAAVEDVQRWRLIQQRRDASSENRAMLDHEKTYEDAELRKEGGLVAGARDTGLKENVSTFANKVGTMEEVGSATTFHSRYFAVGNAVVHVTILTPGSDNPSMTYDKNTTNRVTPGSACNPSAPKRTQLMTPSMVHVINLTTPGSPAPKTHSVDDDQYGPCNLSNSPGSECEFDPAGVSVTDIPASGFFVSSSTTHPLTARGAGMTSKSNTAGWSVEPSPTASAAGVTASNFSSPLFLSSSVAAELNTTD